MEKVKLFVGYDNVESVAYYTYEHSIHSRASIPVNISPIRLNQLRKIHNRERHPLQSNDFSFSRWLVPYLCNYTGWAIFTDCDMLCRTDIAELWELRDSKYAVQVVKHNHVPKEDVKYLNAAQTKYEKKNWSSVMLINCEKCKALTPEYVESASGLDLHQFKWLGDDDLIGGLPKEWNHLVGYNEPNKNAKIVHFTIAGPWLTKARHCEFGDAWREERDAMLYFKDWIGE